MADQDVQGCLVHKPNPQRGIPNLPTLDSPTRLFCRSTSEKDVTISAFNLSDLVFKWHGQGWLGTLENTSPIVVNPKPRVTNARRRISSAIPGQVRPTENSCMEHRCSSLVRNGWRIRSSVMTLDDDELEVVVFSSLGSWCV